MFIHIPIQGPISHRNFKFTTQDHYTEEEVVYINHSNYLYPILRFMERSN